LHAKHENILNANEGSSIQWFLGPAAFYSTMTARLELDEYVSCHKEFRKETVAGKHSQKIILGQFGNL
jgi:hypothetical protein